MESSQRANAKSKAATPRGSLARPLDSLIFLLPLILFYEFGSLLNTGRIVADVLLRRFFELFGHHSVWIPALVIVAILLATHITSGEQWVIHWRKVGWMYVEAPALAIPLLLLNWSSPPLASSTVGPTFLLEKMALGVGAGIYEELVFRLILISIVVILGADVFRLPYRGVGVFAIAASSLVFAAHHHPPIGVEPFELTRFLFRTVAGAYLAVIFWYRGYGLSAGTHAAYNAILVIAAGWIR